MKIKRSRDQGQGQGLHPGTKLRGGAQGCSTGSSTYRKAQESTIQLVFWLFSPWLNVEP